MKPELVRELTESTGLVWLVKARNEIQVLMLRVHQNAPSGDSLGTPDEASPELRQWLLYVGAVFSLWRAVFLVGESDVERRTSELHGKAAEFLKRVIDTNAVTFGDDLFHKTWAAGYYLNNARHRVKALAAFGAEGALRPGIANARIRDVWNETFFVVNDEFDRFNQKRS